VVSDARGHQRLFEDFFDAIHQGREPRCSGRDARQSVALVHAIYEAARTGAWVTL
jgi:predicted dehydrogenase